MDTDNITERTRQFISLMDNKFAEIEEKTKIEASRWRNLKRGATRAVPADMLECLVNIWPMYALWFVTGKTEPENGHISPISRRQDDDGESAAERLRLAARLVWGEDTKKMEEVTGLSKDYWETGFAGEFEVDERLNALLTKGGGQYVTWVISGNPDTYFQLSAKDQWLDKLARGLGADLERKPNSVTAKLAKALSPKSNAKK